MLVLLFENLLFLVLAIAFIFQVIIPIVQGRPIFPMFRKSVSKEAAEWEQASERVQRARHSLEAARLNAEAERIEAEIKAVIEKNKKDQPQ